jgi:tetratricopeptide (TPR) repeat protein
MSILDPNLLANLQQDLLGENADDCRKAIDLLTQPQNISVHIYCYRELVIISQLHPDEDLRLYAAQAVVAQHGQAYLNEEASVFEIFRSIQTLFPWESEAHYYTQIRNYEAFAQAVAQYYPLLCRFATYRQQYLQLAQQLYLLFQLDIPAAEILQHITQYYPQDAEAYYALARIRQQQNQIITAIALYEHCLQIDAQHFYALTALAPLVATQPDKSQYAIALFQRAIDIEPYSSELYADMAQICYQHDEQARARQIIEIALSINPHQPAALNLLGRYYLEVEQDVTKALETYQKGLDNPLHGDNPLLLASMAELCAQSLQEYEKARLYYQKSLAANPIQPLVLLQYVDLLIQFFHDEYEAIQSLQTYLNLRPDDDTISRRLAEIQPRPTDGYNHHTNPIPDNPISQNIDNIDNDDDNDDDDDDDWDAGEAGSDSDE